MDKEKTLSVAKKIWKALSETGHFPEQLSKESYEVFSEDEAAYNHVMWMAEQVEKFLNSRVGDPGKAMRWLGFMQGVLWAKGYFSLDELKEMNKPDNKKFPMTAREHNALVEEEQARR